MKRRLWLAVLLIDLLGIALIPLNLFAFQLPEAVTILFAIAAAALNVLLWCKGAEGKGAKLALSAFSLAAMAITLFGAYCNPYWNSLTFRGGAGATVKDDAMVLSGKDAVADLDYAMKYLRKLHPAFYRNAPREVIAQYELARQNLASMDAVDLPTLNREIESVFATLGDAHTFAIASYNERHWLRHDAADDRIVAVNGLTIDELLAQNARFFSYETEEYGRLWVESRLQFAEGLAYLGIDVDDGVMYTYAHPDGTETTYTFYRDDFAADSSGAGEEASFVSYEIDRAHDLAILRLDQCVYNDAYRKCLKEMFTEVRANGISNVAVDLRRNGGGNSMVADEFIRYLNVREYQTWGSEWRLGAFEIKNEARTVENKRYTDAPYYGKLYVLTAAYTFSSGMDFAMLVKDNHMGTLIGEAPGNLPDSCGDVAMFSLPHSGIYMQISTKRYHRIDREQAGLPVEPDVPCAAAEAMDKLYETIAGRP